MNTLKGDGQLRFAVIVDFEGVDAGIRKLGRTLDIESFNTSLNDRGTTVNGDGGIRTLTFPEKTVTWCFS